MNSLVVSTVTASGMCNSSLSSSFAVRVQQFSIMEAATGLAGDGGGGNGGVVD